MRKETRLALGVVGLSALTTSYLLGNQHTEAGLALGASAATSNVAPAPQASTADAQVTSPAQSTTDTNPQPQDSANATPTQTATPSPAQTQSSGGTFTSQTVQYRYGRIQLEVTVADGALTDINLLQATTEGRGYEQAPPILVDAALKAGGTDFGNLSGATFTTQAFKQALTDALSQAGM